jgi:hypothetical protein
VIGLAGSSILCTALSVALGLHFYSYASGPFVTTTGLSAIHVAPQGIFGGRAANVHTLLLVQAALGLFLSSFARGAITHIALHRTCDAPARLHEACRAAMARLPALLVGSLIYSGLTALGAIGLSLLLREMGLDVSIVGERARSLEAMPHLVALRTADALLPDPGSPFVEFVPYWRSITLERAPTVGASAFWPLVVAGIALIILADAMLRFRTVSAIKPNGYEITHGLARFAWLIESVRLGLGHFWQVSTHMCLLRLAALHIIASLLILPVVLIETIVMPQTMRLFQASLVLPPTIPLICASVAFVCAALRAFSIVYDARLYLALSQNSKSTSATPFSWQYLR